MKLKKRLKILVTSGPTREPLDPVRFISNYSTGVLGHAIAQEAKRRRHRVILISGPTALAKPRGVRCIDVQTVRRMQQAIEAHFGWCACLVMTAAICDFRAARVAKQKIKRGSRKTFTLALRRNPDILAGFGRKKKHRIVVGFGLETEHLKTNTLAKLRQKHLDLIVTTLMTKRSYPFGRVKLDVLIMGSNGQAQKLHRASKQALARLVVKKLEDLTSTDEFS